MYKMILENIQGVEIWAVIALLIFFTFFVGVLVWVVCLKKEDLQQMANIPLEEDEKSIKNGDLSHG